MGVIYKLKPETKEFILEQKRLNPNLSCRNLADLVQVKFQFKLSKSTINSIIRVAGMSMPVGRRREKKRRAAVSAQPAQEIKLLGAPAASAAEIKEAPPQPVSVEKTAQIPIPEPSVEAKPPEAPKPAEIPKPKPVAEPKPAEEIEVECTGAILLKAMDSLIGGSRFILAELRKELPPEEPDLLAKTDALIYLPLFHAAGQRHIKVFAPLCSLIDKEIFLEDILSYLNLLQSVRIKTSELLSGLLNLLRQVRGIKVNLSSGKEIYLDAQFHTVWPTQLSPHSFSVNIYNIKSYINKYFFRDQPLVLFMAPDFEAPSEEFFNFLLGLNSQGQSISRLDIFGNKFEQLQTIQIEDNKKRFFIFGLWPAQFVEHRTINKIGDFKPFVFEPLKREFLLAETEIELSQPNTNQQVTLKGCVLRNSPAEKPCLIILSNLPQTGIENLAQIYLSRWPNIEEGLRDFSQKTELFSYIGDKQPFFSTQNLGLDDSSTEIKALFNNYLKILDLYFKWYFLGEEFKDKDFPTMKGIFYDLKVILKKEKDRIFVTFGAPMGFPFKKDLAYACRRLNEREIEFGDGRRLWFRI